jgi:thiol-disulfide isomerase/thioredoxin
MLYHIQIAVASPSSSRVLFIGNPKSIISPAQKGLSNASMYGKPSCLLFLACSKYKSQWCGTCLSEPLFNAICPSNAGMKAEILLLQGLSSGWQLLYLLISVVYDRSLTAMYRQYGWLGLCFPYTTENPNSFGAYNHL